MPHFRLQTLYVLNYYLIFNTAVVEFQRWLGEVKLWDSDLGKYQFHSSPGM